MQLLPMIRGIAVCAIGLIAAASAEDRPRVLIIGDSISLGYTPHVIRTLQPEADVVHNKGNAQHTMTGLSKIDAWLGDEDWDVIHFNWGLWDLCYRHPESKNQGRRDKERGTLTTSLEDYEANLDKLVARLKQTDATLIWAHTTVVPEGEAGRKRNDDLKYNEAATRVMAKYNVEINDLNAVSRKLPASMFTKPGDVHMKSDGYELLAAAVSRRIQFALRKRRPMQRILFGSCIRQDKPVPIFDAILSERPELFVFLGDNIYGDSEDMNVLKQKYQALQANEGFQKLRQSCPTIATWDDHDYGVNDGGAEYTMREASEQLFEEFWGGQPAAHQRPGVYDAHTFGPPGRRVQVILMDTRFFRSPLKHGPKRVGGSWQPDNDPQKTMLGEAQWKWLEEQLQQPADIRIVASSIQFVAQDAGQETWSNLPREKQRMLDLLKRTKANGVLLISGDRHWSELSALNREGDYPLLDLTSSSLNQPHGRGTPTENRFRVSPTTYHKENFGMIAIDWESETIELHIKDTSGADQLTHQLHLSDLSSK